MRFQSRCCCADALLHLRERRIPGGPSNPLRNVKRLARLTLVGEQERRQSLPERHVGGPRARIAPGWPAQALIGVGRSSATRTAAAPRAWSQHSCSRLGRKRLLQRAQVTADDFGSRMFELAPGRGFPAHRPRRRPAVPAARPRVVPASRPRAARTCRRRCRRARAGSPPPRRRAPSPPAGAGAGAPRRFA